MAEEKKEAAIEYLENPSHAQHGIEGIIKGSAKLSVRHKEDDVGLEVDLSVNVKWENQDLQNRRVPPKGSKIVLDRSFVQTSTEMLVSFVYNSEMDAFEFAKWAAVIEEALSNNQDCRDMIKVLTQEARYEYMWRELISTQKTFYLVSVKPQSLKKRPTRPQYRMEEGTVTSFFDDEYCHFQKTGSPTPDVVFCLRVLPSGLATDRLYIEKNK
jgi:hypothetical protein